MASLQVAAPFVIAAGAIWPVVCGGMVALRFFIRRAQDGAYGPDDWLILPALLFLCGMCAAALSGAALHAVGYPTPPVPPEQTLTATSREQTIARIVYWSAQCMQCVALTALKLSALFFYRRIFGKAGRGSVEIALYVMQDIIAAWGVSFFFALFFTCNHHFLYLWTNLENQMKYDDTVATQLGYAISDVITDLIILIFPLPLVWQLHMTWRYKLAVTAIFLVGSLSIAASAVRLAISIQTLNAEFLAGVDSDFLSTDALYFQIIEVGLALCAVCMPTVSGGLKLQSVKNLRQYLSRLGSPTASPPRSKSSDNIGKQGAVARSLSAPRRAQNPTPGWKLFTDFTDSNRQNHTEETELELFPTSPRIRDSQPKGDTIAV